MTTLDPAAPVVEHEGRRLDWRPRYDPRSLDHRMAAGVTALPTTGRRWRHGPVLDQGAEGHCVAFGCSGEAAAEPVPVPGITDATAHALFHRLQLLDEWPGENYEGTSVLAGCLGGRERGWWGGFQWAKSAEELAHGIVRSERAGGGPAVIGVEWRAGSYDTDALGVLTPSGDVVGGHCLLVVGFVPARPSKALRDQLAAAGLLAGWQSIGGPAFVILNSWGLAFGQGGLCLVTVDTMRAWVRAGAELAMPVDRKLPATRAAAEKLEVGHRGAEVSTDRTHHLVATELRHGDRITAGLPDELGQETATVVERQLLVMAGGPRVRVHTTAGSFDPSASDEFTIRRPVA